MVRGRWIWILVHLCVHLPTFLSGLLWRGRSECNCCEWVGLRKSTHMHNHTLSPTWSYHGASHIDSLCPDCDRNWSKLNLDLECVGWLKGTQEKPAYILNHQAKGFLIVSHKLHHWFSFCIFCGNCCCFALVRSTADVFFARNLKPKLLIHGGKEKEVHKTEILVSVAGFLQLLEV